MSVIIYRQDSASDDLNNNAFVLGEEKHINVMLVNVHINRANVNLMIKYRQNR